MNTPKPVTAADQMVLQAMAANEGSYIEAGEDHSVLKNRDGWVIAAMSLATQWSVERAIENAKAEK